MKGLVFLLVVFGLTLLPWHAFHAVRYGKSLFLPPSLGAGGLLAQATLEAKGRIEGDPSYFEGVSESLVNQGADLDDEYGNAGGVAVAGGKVLRDLMEHPGEYLHFVALKFQRMWGLAPEKGAYSRPWIVIPTGALNLLLYAGFLAGLFLHRRRQEALLALTLVVIYTVPHLIFYAQPRYRLPVVPAMMVFAGVSASVLLAWIGARRRAVAASRL